MEIGDFEIKLGTPKMPITKLLVVIDSKNAGMLQLFDPNFICCKEHLQWAYANAYFAFKEHSNRARGMKMEVLLYAAMTYQIGDAIAKAGAKEGMEAIILYDNKFKSSKIRLSGLFDNLREYDISANSPTAAKKIKKLGIKSGDVKDLIQAIAQSAMR